MKKIVFAAVFAALCAAGYAQSADPFSGGRWQVRISYRDGGGISHIELYELILVPGGACIVTVSGRQGGVEVFQDADGLWSFDETFFRLECVFFDPVFEHIPGINWAGVYRFDARASRFTLLVKPYPDAPNTIKAAFNRIDD
jgi:hypothetical protein